MLFNYSEPPTYANDPLYKGCQCIEEMRVLRLILTYVDFVGQKYGRPQIQYTTFKGKSGENFHNSRKYYVLSKIVGKLREHDPAHFVSFVFETWKGRGHYEALKSKGLKNKAGASYPSWNYLETNWEQLVDEFLNTKGYKPTGFVPVDEIDIRWKEAIAGRVSRWCAAHKKTSEDYWLTPRHLFPPHLTAKELPFAESLWENQEPVERKMGFSLEDLRKFLADELAKTTKVPMTRIPDEEYLDDYTLARVHYIREAMAYGVDVESEEFEARMEEDLNPIDRDHPDSVMYFTYGHGVPRKGFE